MIDGYSEDFLRSQAATFVKEKMKKSKILSVEKENLIPRFDPSEIKYGNELGRGGFCNVYAVKKVVLNEQSDTMPADSDSNSEHDENMPP